MITEFLISQLKDISMRCIFTDPNSVFMSLKGSNAWVKLYFKKCIGSAFIAFQSRCITVQSGQTNHVTEGVRMNDP